MTESTSTTVHLLQAWREGDLQALDKLIDHSYQRLNKLARMMYADFPRAQALAEADDILHGALLRLMKAVKELAPTASGDFYRLAALQIRRELLDTVRKISRAPLAANLAMDKDTTSDGLADPAGPSTYNPDKLAVWAEFHKQVDALPDDERAVFDLLWYHGLQQVEAAEVLAVDPKTIQRRWRRAIEALLHAVPGLDACMEGAGRPAAGP